MYLKVEGRHCRLHVRRCVNAHAIGNREGTIIECVKAHEYATINSSARGSSIMPCARPAFLEPMGPCSSSSSCTGVMDGASRTGIELRRWGASALRMMLHVRYSQVKNAWRCCLQAAQALSAEAHSLCWPKDLPPLPLDMPPFHAYTRNIGFWHFGLG